MAELIHYTDEQRARWEQWFRDNGEDLLKMPLKGDRDACLGGLLLNIFGTERRYLQRLSDEPLSGYRGRPCGTIDQVFGFGLESRRTLRDYVRVRRPEDWSRTVQFEIGGKARHATVRKVILHTLLHEVRVWAEIARLMRERGFDPPAEDDLLDSTALF